MANPDVIRVFVGADRSQRLAIRVLEYSIRRHTTAQVEVIPMVDLEVPRPKNPRNDQRTGFSFSRFCIPALTDYRGKAIYMDADMLVFSDIRELWEIPFDGAKVVIQEEVKFADITTLKSGAPKVRRKQCAVMLLDCSRLDWRIENIVAAMDAGHFGYEQLLYELCILEEEEIKYGVPFEWNSLEHFDHETRLLHFTDMATQPWVSSRNKNGHTWLAEVRRMLKHGALKMGEIEDEISAGFFRPSLLRDLKWRHFVPRMFLPIFDSINTRIDFARGYQPHKDLYDAKRALTQRIKDHDYQQGQGKLMT